MFVILYVVCCYGVKVLGCVGFVYVLFVDDDFYVVFGVVYFGLLFDVLFDRIG